MTSPLRGSKAAAIRNLYAAGLTVGAYSHLSSLVRHGWRWTYGGKPIGVVIFWSALAFVDPLLIAVLFVRPRLGTVLLALLMLADVVLNTGVVVTCGGIVWMVFDQWIFFVFVVVTLPLIWRSTDSRVAPTSQQAESQVL